MFKKIFFVVVFTSFMFVSFTSVKAQCFELAVDSYLACSDHIFRIVESMVKNNEIEGLNKFISYKYVIFLKKGQEVVDVRDCHDYPMSIVRIKNSPDLWFVSSSAVVQCKKK